MGLRARLIAMLVVVMVLASLLMVVGVNFGLRNDVRGLAAANAESGANVLTGVLDASQQTIRSTIQRGSGQVALAKAVTARDVASLRAAAFDMAAAGELSFVVVTDARGTVIAATRAAAGNIASNAAVASAMTGSAIDGPQQFTRVQLRSLGISAPPRTIALVSAAPVKVDGQIVGVLYGGEIVDSTMHALNDVSRFTGGATGVAIDGAFAGTSLSSPDGAPLIGTLVPHASDAAGHQIYSGLERVAGVDYFVKITPVISFDGSVLGAYWFGVPFAQFNVIVGNTLRQIVLWTVIGLGIALVAGSVAAARIGRAITIRSDEVNESARQLKVLVVGGEVSGDHVGRTRATLERIASIVSSEEEVARGGAQLRTLAHQAVDEVLVIDTLTGELSTRMRDAARRVERLSAVAQELDDLVAGAHRSRN